MINFFVNSLHFNDYVKVKLSCILNMSSLLIVVDITLGNVPLATDMYLIEVSITIIGDGHTMYPAFSFYVQIAYSLITH